jgi:cyclopropane-fatty-acyl-phospholipid synthase
LWYRFERPEVVARLSFTAAFAGRKLMMALASIHAERTKLFNNLFRNYQSVPFAIRTPGGWRWNSSPFSDPEFTLVFKTSDVLQVLIDNPNQLKLGKAFIEGDLDIEGDLFSAFDAEEHILAQPLHFSEALVESVGRALSHVVRGLVCGRRHSRRRDRSSISHHYDLPIQFFRPWLGSTLVYSCAYFRDLKRDDLDSAQNNKLELICRKLDLQRGERFLDIGCGWGSLAMYAASHYGANSRGITLSREQALVAARRISQEKLGRQCFVEMRDYRDAPLLPYRYDKMASIGMFEHVGVKNLGKYFSIAYQMLKPCGLFLNHGIARSYSNPPRKDSFIDKYVFPDGELATVSDTVELAESAGFEVRDVDNLREHYTQTLRMWVEALRSNATAILEIVPEATYRTWLLYMAGSAAAFQRGDILIYQILLRRSERNVGELPVARENCYRGWEDAPARRTA